MGKATSMAHREQVVSLKKEGHSYGAISEQLCLSCSNLRDIWQANASASDSPTGQVRACLPGRSRVHLESL